MDIRYVNLWAISRRDSTFSAFRMGPVASGHDCVISLKYYSELPNHGSENWEVFARRKYTDNLAFSILIINRYIFDIFLILIDIFSPCPHMGHS